MAIGRHGETARHLLVKLKDYSALKIRVPGSECDGYTNPQCLVILAQSPTSEWSREVKAELQRLTQQYGAPESDLMLRYLAKSLAAVSNRDSGGWYQILAPLASGSRFFSQKMHLTPGTAATAAEKKAACEATPGYWYNYVTGACMPAGADVAAAATPLNPEACVAAGGEWNYMTGACMPRGADVGGAPLNPEACAAAGGEWDYVANVCVGGGAPAPVEKPTNWKLYGLIAGAVVVVGVGGYLAFGRK